MGGERALLLPKMVGDPYLSSLTIRQMLHYSITNTTTIILTVTITTTITTTISNTFTMIYNFMLYLIHVSVPHYSISNTTFVTMVPSPPPVPVRSPSCYHIHHHSTSNHSEQQYHQIIIIIIIIVMIAFSLFD